MLEIRVATNRGWMALECKCPAGRAIFSDEESANAALELHLRVCVQEPAQDGKYRSCAVAPDAAA